MDTGIEKVTEMPRSIKHISMITHRQNNRGSDGSDVLYLVRFELYKKDQLQNQFSCWIWIRVQVELM
jgi:hypothetical protein